MTQQLGRVLIVAGLAIVVLGAALILGDRLGFRLGRLPLDFRYQRDNFSVYLPLGTSILLSLFASLIFFVVNRIR